MYMAPHIVVAYGIYVRGARERTCERVYCVGACSLGVEQVQRLTE